MHSNRFLRYSLGVALTVVIVSASLGWFGATVKSHVRHLDQHWRIDNKHAAESAYAISQIQSTFGYGGFIHNFKNFVLRRDASRIALIDRNLADTYEAIERFERLAITPQERDAIARFRQVVDLYAGNYGVAKQLAGQGLSSDLIDAQVRVDDRSALQALEYLSKATLEYSRSVTSETGHAIAIMLAFMDWGWLSLPVILLVGAIVILMLHRLIKGSEALENARRYADDLLKAAPDALIVVGKDGVIVSANIEAQLLFGYGMNELVGLPLEQLMPERFRHAHSGYVRKAFDLERPRPLDARTELVALTRQGEEFPVEISLSYTIQDGQPLSIAAIRNISARKKAEQHLRLARKVLDEASEGILITDADTRIVDVNAAFCQLSGYTREELLGQQPSMLNSGRHDEEFYRQMWQRIAGDGYWKGEIWDRRKDGQLIPVLVSISAVVEKSGEASHYVALFSDITQIKEKEQSLELMAHFDGLTGLANRMLFHDRLRAALHRAHRKQSCCALFYIDLDGFKQINDQFGHGMGDEVLIKVAGRINQTIREDDTAARLGGDEFAVIFNELSRKDDAEMLAARLLEQLTFDVASGTGRLPISASIGIALYPDDGDSVESLLRCADEAMYYCKRHGKHGYHHYREAPGAASNRNGTTPPDLEGPPLP